MTLAFDIHARVPDLRRVISRLAQRVKVDRLRRLLGGGRRGPQETARRARQRQAARPQQRRATELAGTTYLNGWGAMCYPAGANAPDNSFSSWTCAEGLTCQAAPGAKVSGAGFCFPKGN